MYRLSISIFGLTQSILLVLSPLPPSTREAAAESQRYNELL